MTEEKPLTPEQAAEFLRVSPATLDNWRSAGIGPKFYKPTGKLIYYYQSDLQAWVKQTENGSK